MPIRYAANGQPMVEKKKPIVQAPHVVEKKVEPVVNVDILNDSLKDEDEISENNE